MFEQATGQSKIEIFAKGENDYFLKVVEAQLTFITDANGQATALVLHQDGGTATGKRVEQTAQPPPPIRSSGERFLHEFPHSGVVDRYRYKTRGVRIDAR